MTAHNCRTFRPILNRLDDRCLLSGLTMRTGNTLRSVSPVLQPFAIPKKTGPCLLEVSPCSEPHRGLEVAVAVRAHGSASTEQAMEAGHDTRAADSFARRGDVWRGRPAGWPARPVADQPRGLAPGVVVPPHLGLRSQAGRLTRFR